jgi:hypothetical protein
VSAVSEATVYLLFLSHISPSRIIPACSNIDKSHSRGLLISINGRFKTCTSQLKKPLPLNSDVFSEWRQIDRFCFFVSHALRFRIHPACLRPFSACLLTFAFCLRPYSHFCTQQLYCYYSMAGSLSTLWSAYSFDCCNHAVEGDSPVDARLYFVSCPLSK